MTSPSPHSLNVPGPFYIEDGCCTSCMAAPTEAPGHIHFDDATKHCYVAHQPSSADDFNSVVRAAWVAELSCVRYRGTEQSLLIRLAEAGLRSICDTTANNVAPLWRNVATFSRPGSLGDLARALSRYLSQDRDLQINIRWRPRSRRLDLQWAPNARARIDLRSSMNGWQATILKVGGAGAGLSLRLATALTRAKIGDALWTSAAVPSVPGTPWPV